MRIGILADIHGHVENLRKAIRRLEREQVEQFVVLGDVIYERGHAAETVDLLKDVGAVGVWGNHELGLCINPSDELRERYTQPVVDFFGTLAPQYERGELLFSHTLPDQDASDPLSYYLGPGPDDAGALNACFARFPHRAMMVGHFHRWLAATPAARLAWEGEEPVELEAGTRYFFAIHAVKDGWAALLDDSQGVLGPIQL
jgi:hypothetical protein